jgi:membrane-associated phospholipid phosphatase
MDMTISVTKKAIEKTQDFSYAIGYFSEMILPIIVVFYIYHDLYAHIVYFVGYFISIYLNIWLKNTIKEPRPKPYFHFLANESTKKDDLTVYGMPSGHSQNVFYSIMYLYMYFRSFHPWILISIGIGVLTIMERWLFRNHTLFQLCIGALIGSALGYIVFTVQTELLKIYKKGTTLSV